MDRTRSLGSAAPPAAFTEAGLEGLALEAIGVVKTAFGALVRPCPEILTALRHQVSRRNLLVDMASTPIFSRFFHLFSIPFVIFSD